MFYKDIKSDERVAKGIISNARPQIDEAND
jgi:hypothetical protein